MSFGNFKQSTHDKDDVFIKHLQINPRTQSDENSLTRKSYSSPIKGNRNYREEETKVNIDFQQQKNYR